MASEIEYLASLAPQLGRPVLLSGEEMREDVQDRFRAYGQGAENLLN